MPAIGLKNLCPPAFLYLLLSVLAIIVMWLQNINNEAVYCLGNYSCSVSSKAMIFAIKILYVLFWTWLLNIICKSGFIYVSWVLVLFPFLLSFILIAMLFTVELDNPFSKSNVNSVSSTHIPIFSSFYQWLMY
jgi:hypothetical protein